MTILLVGLAAVAFAIAVPARRAASQARLSELKYRALATQWPDSAMGLLDRDMRFTLFAGDAFAPYRAWRPARPLHESARELLARAGAALYDAKRAGRAKALISPSPLSTPRPATRP